MITRKSLADEIDAIDESIKALNDSKRDAFAAYRDQLETAGVAKVNIKLEIDATKEAIKRRRLVIKDAFAVEEKDALVDEILEEITARAPRAHVENIEEFPPHDTETGELISDQPQAGGSDAKSADDRCFDSDLIDRRRRPAATEPERQPAEETESNEAPAESVADEISVPIPTPAPSSSHAAGQTDDVDLLPASSVTIPEPFEPPAFLRKTAADFRPHCRDPKNCASGSIHKHCHGCQKLIDAEARETEAA